MGVYGLRGTRLSALVALTLGVIAGLARPGWADDDDADFRPGISDMSRGGRGSVFSATIQFSRTDDDGFIDLELAAEFSVGPIRLGFWVPLRFRVQDRTPADDGVFRTEDWDEFAEWMRVLRFVEVGQRPPMGERSEGYHARAGELIGARLGHGTLVNRYNNVVDVDHFQWGVEGAGFFWFGGFEALIDNVADPEVMGLRLHVRPWTFAERGRAPRSEPFGEERQQVDSGDAPVESYWTNLAFGLTVVGDVDAPRTVDLDDEGNYVIDEDGRITVDDASATGFIGLDAELQALTTDKVLITPYTDLNFHLAQGLGWHVGSLYDVILTDWFDIDGQLEAMVLGPNYIPHYVDWLYEVERVHYVPLEEDGPVLPKLQVLEAVRVDPALGGYAELGLRFFGMLKLTVAYLDYEGDDNAGIYLKLSLRNLGPVRIRVYWVNSGFDLIGESLDRETGNAMLVSQIRLDLFNAFFVRAEYGYRWRAREGGTFETVQDWGIAGGLRLRF